MTVKEYLILEHKINKGNTKVQQVKESAPKAIKTASTQINHIKKVCREYGIEIIEEKTFSEIRRWRFDMFSNELQLAIEYEGIVSGQSRHTNIVGYTNDTDKYNNAQSKGIHVFRFTALNYKNFELELLRYFYFHGINIKTK